MSSDQPASARSTPFAAEGDLSSVGHRIPAIVRIRRREGKALLEKRFAVRRLGRELRRALAAGIAAASKRLRL